jgi:hypothetical protein
MKKYLYDIPFIHEQFDELSSKDFFSEKTLQITNVKNGIVLPPYGGGGDKISDGILDRGGVLDEDGNYIEESRLAGWMEGSYEVSKNSIKKYSFPVLYFGYMLGQWGHFLLNFIPRLWYYIKNRISLNEHERIRIGCLFNHNSTFESMHYDFFELLDIQKDQILLITEPSQFSSVIIPEYSANWNSLRPSDHQFDIPDYYTKEYLSIINFVTENIRAKKPANFVTYDKVFYSRRKYGTYRDFGDEYIEQFFSDNGYKIIHPEELSVVEKLLIVHECTHFASIIGTTTHFSLFAKESAQIIVLNKHIELNKYQFMIDKMKGYEVIYIDSYLSLFPVYWLGPFLHTVTNNLIAFAKDHGMKLPQKCANFDNIKKYLRLYFNQMKTFDDYLPSVYHKNAYFMRELYNIVHDDFLRQLEDDKDYDSMRFLLPHIKQWGKNKVKQIYIKIFPVKIRKLIRKLRGKA